MTQLRDSLILFNKLKKGDILAFNEIYKHFSSKVLNFAHSFTISKEDAEEIVQDVFLKLWKIKETLDLEKSPDTLIFVITKNFVFNKIKKFSTEKEHLKKYFHTQHELFSSNIEDRLNFQEMESYFSQIINDLPEKRREIFKLNRFKGLTYKETAKKLDISEGTVEKQMSKALKTIHEKFQFYAKFLLPFLLFIH